MKSYVAKPMCQDLGCPLLSRRARLRPAARSNGPLERFGPESAVTETDRAERRTWLSSARAGGGVKGVAVSWRRRSGRMKRVPVRAIRGAIQVDVDDRDAILEATTEMVRAVLARNGLAAADLISIVFTATPDLTAEFPAYAARQLGLTDVPLLCATEIAVPGAMPRVLRLLAHAETDLPRAAIRHVYLRGAAGLRTDLPR